MNILYLCHRIPYPPDKGDKIRAFRHLEHLTHRHDVWCACFVDSPMDYAHVDSLRRVCRDVAAIPLDRRRAATRAVLGLVTGSTVTESFYRDMRMWETLRDWRCQVSFDSVIAFSSSMAPYALDFNDARRVLDFCDLDSHKWRDLSAVTSALFSWLYRLESRRLFARELQWLGRADAVILISDEESAVLGELAAAGKAFTVTNGVEVPAVPCNHCTFTQTDPVIGFVGVMNYLPNVDGVCWFVEQCWSEIRAAYPTAQFRIAGRSPVRRVRRLARIPGVQVVGAVDDAQAELRGFDISVAPLRIARGLQNKVLEAMAAGLPVVLTPQAAAGIRAADGHQYLVADSPDRMIRAIRRLSTDPAERQRIGLAAREFVSIHHHWHDALTRFEWIATGALSKAAPRSAVVAPPAPKRVEHRAPRQPSSAPRHAAPLP